MVPVTITLFLKRSVPKSFIGTVEIMKNADQKSITFGVGWTNIEEENEVFWFKRSKKLSFEYLVKDIKEKKLAYSAIDKFLFQFFAGSIIPAVEKIEEISNEDYKKEISAFSSDTQISEDILIKLFS